MGLNGGFSTLHLHFILPWIQTWLGRQPYLTKPPKTSSQARPREKGHGWNLDWNMEFGTTFIIIICFCFKDLIIYICTKEHVVCKGFHQFARL